MRAICHSTQEKFLSNKNNKTSIITLISKYLEEDGQVKIQCDGDADPTVVSTTISLSSSKRDNSVMVAADDTNITIMLSYHWNGEMSEIIFNSKKSETVWSIARACSNLEDKKHLLFVHVWSVCDTVSATFEKGRPQQTMVAFRSW